MAQYFENDKSIKSKVDKKKVIIKNQEFFFFTDNGVFSKKGLDYGTRSLLEALPNDISGKCLDMGCGYGPIGIFLKKTYDVSVDMVDINLRSLKLALKNADANKVSVHIFESDAFKSIKEKYDYIITNPPIRVGKEKLYEILTCAKEHLKKNGKLYFVINKNQGAKSVIKDLSSIYKINVIEKNKGFFIILEYID